MRGSHWAIIGVGLATLASVATVVILISGSGPSGPQSLPAATESSAKGSRPSGLTPSQEAFDLLASGRTAEAQDRYRSAAQSDPQDRDARLGLTLIALIRHDLVEASRYNAEAIELAPEAPEARSVAAALALLREPGDAEAAAVARAVLKKNPRDLIARWAVIRSLLQGDSPCSAIPEIDAAIAELPGSYELEELRLAAFSAAGDRRGAGEQLVRMHGKFPEDADLRGWVLDWYGASGDTEAATAILREQASGADVEASTRLVDHVRQAEGDAAGDAELARLADAAEASEETALARRFRTDLAASLFRQGRVDEAIDLLEDVVRPSRPTAEAAHDAKAELARLLAARGAAGDAERAQTLVAEVLAADSGHAEALMTRASWFIAAREPRGALGDLQVALGANPTDAAILSLMAAAYELEGAEAMTADSLAKAVEFSGGGAAETERYVRFLRERGRDAVADALMQRPEPVKPPVRASAPLDGSARCPAPDAP